MKIIQISDTHLSGVDRGNVYGLNPAYRLKRAIKSINQFHADAAFIVITGDLADVASEGAYKILAKIISKSKVPVYPILGNHDMREAFGKAFPEYIKNGFVQYIKEAEGNTFLFLDTLVEGKRYGKLCEKRLKWLKNALVKHRKQPLYIFMHHHPVDSGLYEMDVEADFRSKKEFWELLDKRKNIRHITFGHLHRIMHANRGAVSMHSTRSTTFQVSYQPHEKLEYLTNRERPTYAVMEIDENGMGRIHHHEYLDEKVFYEDGSRSQS